MIWFEVFVLVLFAELGTSEKVYGACFDVKEELLHQVSLGEQVIIDNSSYFYSISMIEVKWGKVCFSEENDIHINTFWDIIDIIMAGSSWADLFSDPSWGNFAWAVLDTAALLPYLPSSAYFRKGEKVYVKAKEVAKYYKTTKGKKVVTAAMKGYKYADGITPKAIKTIKKTFKDKEAKEVLKIFKKAANRGLVGGTNQTGIKKLTGKVNKIYTHEIKVTGKYGQYRIFGYKKANGEWVFDYFVKAHK